MSRDSNATEWENNNNNSAQSVTAERKNNLTDPWSELSHNIKAKAPEEHMFEIVVAATVLNSIWLVSTLALAVGNAEKCRDMLKPWIGVTVIVTVTDIAATVFYIFKAIKENNADEFDFKTTFFTNIYVFYAVMFSRGGIIIWIINVALCVFVAQRVKEIEVTKNKHLPFGAYSPPYDAYETQSTYDTSKGERPHTPPPDYSNGKKRRPSVSSETVTLPLSSTCGSLGQKGVVLYDDRVEHEHRTSCAAETVLHHAYINKGLVEDSEGWMGIPRPTLKSSHS